MPTDVQFQQKGPIGYVTFATESGVNVLSTCTMAALEARLDDVARHPEVRVLILSGSGKTFMAGADIKEMHEAPGDAGRQYSRRGQQCMNRLAHFDHAVTIAAINGAALGGGCELALACDLRVMAAEAKIGFPEVKLGLIPGWGGTQRAYMLMGPSRARRILMTGTPITAEVAASADLVNEVVPADRLIATCEEIAGQILSNGPGAVRLVKRVVSSMEQALLDRGMHFETEAFGEAFISEEGREGLRAFLEKRKPAWAE